MTIEALNPPAERRYKKINDESLVLKIRYQDTSFLLTGDIETPAMARLVRTGNLASTVLKVPHHGARLTEDGKAFVRAVSPRFSVISAGENNPFGHPKPETLRTLEGLSSNAIFRTDRDGAVSLISDGKAIRAEGFAKQ